MAALPGAEQASTRLGMSWHAEGKSAGLLAGAGWWRVAAGAVLSVLAPGECQACGGPLLEPHGFAVCQVCLEQLRPDGHAKCERCGEWLEADDLSGAGFSRESAILCSACQDDPPSFGRATAFAAYDGTLRKLIRLHKFHGMEPLARPLGACLAEVLRTAAASLPSGPVSVVAVPLWGRKRGFNQSAAVADEAVRHLRVRGEATTLRLRHGALRRVRETVSQSHLSPRQRRENVRGAFTVTGDVGGWQVLLIDDVYTTGATAAECTRTLLRAGAAGVQVVTLARTQPERVARWESWKHGTGLEHGIGM